MSKEDKDIIGEGILVALFLFIFIFVEQQHGFHSAMIAAMAVICAKLSMK